MNPCTFSGDEKLRNLRLLHEECHRELHADFTREEMAEYSNSGIDYLRLLKRKRSPEQIVRAVYVERRMPGSEEAVGR